MMKVIFLLLIQTVIVNQGFAQKFNPVIKQDIIIQNMNISFEQKVSLYIEKYHSDYKAIIQNGSWFSLIPSSKPRIALIQDNLRKMGRFSNIQEYNFKNAEYIITNSNEVDNYYNQRQTVQIPLGVDNKLFAVLDKNEMRKKYKIPLAIDSSV